MQTQPEEELSKLLSVATAIMLAALASSAGAVDFHHPTHIYLQVHIDVDKNGYLFDVLPIDMTVPAATQAACIAFTEDPASCASFAPAMGMRAHPIPHDKRDGDTHTGLFLAPTGFEICRARVVYPDSAGTGSSVAVRIMRNTDGLGPKNSEEDGLAYEVRLTSGADRDKGVHAILDMDFIDGRLSADPVNACLPTGSVQP